VGESIKNDGTTERIGKKDMKFINTEKLWQLHELEQTYLKLGRGVVNEARYIRQPKYKAREMGRASGFFACAHMIDDIIARNDRGIK